MVSAKRNDGVGAVPSVPSLEIDRRAAPRGGIPVGDRLRERPSVSADVLGGVLALAIGVVGGWSQNSCARSHGCGVMFVVVLDPNEHRVCRAVRCDRRRAIELGQIMAPSPNTSCTRWVPIRSRSRNPKARQSHSAASATSAYASSRVTADAGMERFRFHSLCFSLSRTWTIRVISAVGVGWSAGKRIVPFPARYGVSSSPSACMTASLAGKRL